MILNRKEDKVITNYKKRNKVYKNKYLIYTNTILRRLVTNYYNDYKYIIYRYILKEILKTTYKL